MSAKGVRGFSGSTIREARQAAGMSRLDLARAINFIAGPQSIARYESGQIVPSFNIVLRIASALNTNVEEFTDAAS